MEARQTPTFEQSPEFSATDGTDAARLASTFFGEPVPWQTHVLDAMLARDERDKYLNHTFALSVARQNGKSWDVRARVFYGIISAGEKVLYTCQHGDTADEMFKALAAPFEDEDETELHALLKTVRKTNGQQAIYLTNGGMVRFTTRTDSLARGRSYDVLIYDEAQELTAAQQEASLPTISASSQHNTQVIYLGTPPGPECAGTVFRELHDRVHDGKSKAAWMEWSADRPGDPNDKALWYETNPSLGTLIDESAIESEAAGMSQDGFCRERLNWWSSVGPSSSPIGAREWDACRVAEPPKGGIVSYGVKFAPDGSMYAISAAVRKGDRCFVEVVDYVNASHGTEQLAAWIAQRKSEFATVAIDGRVGSDALSQRLVALGIPTRQMILTRSAQVAAAASMLVDMVRSQRAEHMGFDILTESATKCAKRPIGSDGAFSFGLGVTDSTPVESAALALWAAMTTKRDPKRRQRIL